VPYYIQVPRKELERLEGLPHVSPGRLANVLEEVWSYLSNITDQFREDRRLGPGSSYFLLDFLFEDEGHGHQLLFYVNDSHAAAGVLVVVFVDHKFGRSLTA